MGVFVPNDLRPRNLIKYDNSRFLPAEEKEFIPQKGTLGSNFTTTDHDCYILETEEPFERLEIQFVPNEISTPREANLTEIMVVARNNPKYHYINGKDTLRMQVEFYSDERGRTDVIRKVQWLKSLTMNNGFQGGLRNVKIVFGELFPNEVWLLKSVRPTLSHFDGEAGFLPLRARVDLEFVLDPVKNNLITDVRL